MAAESGRPGASRRASAASRPRSVSSADAPAPARAATPPARMSSLAARAPASAVGAATTLRHASSVSGLRTPCSTHRHDPAIQGRSETRMPQPREARPVGAACNAARAACFACGLGGGHAHRKYSDAPCRTAASSLARSSARAPGVIAPPSAAACASRDSRTVVRVTLRARMSGSGCAQGEARASAVRAWRLGPHCPGAEEAEALHVGADPRPEAGSPPQALAPLCAAAARRRSAPRRAMRGGTRPADSRGSPAGHFQLAMSTKTRAGWLEPTPSLHPTRIL